MATTKKKIAEQIFRIIQGGDPAGASNVKLPEVMLLVEQSLNTLLKIERFTNLKEGDRYPVDLAIATYDNLAVTTYKDVSKCVLPAMPIAMSRGRGVWQVSKTDSISDPFIPLQPGQWAMVKNQRLLGELSGLVGYEVFGKDVVFTQNLVGQGVTAVMIKLIVSDFSQLSETDLLPIPADMEIQVIKMVLEMLGVYQKEDNAINGVDNK